MWRPVWPRQVSQQYWAWATQAAIPCLLSSRAWPIWVRGKKEKFSFERPGFISDVEMWASRGGINIVWGRSIDSRSHQGVNAAQNCLWRDLFIAGSYFYLLELVLPQVVQCLGLLLWLSTPPLSPEVHKAQPFCNLSFWICGEITHFLTCHHSWFFFFY